MTYNIIMVISVHHKLLVMKSGLVLVLSCIPYIDSYISIHYSVDINTKLSTC